MSRYIVRRVLQFIPTLLGVVLMRSEEHTSELQSR